MTRLLLRLVPAAALLITTTLAQTPPREKFQNADVLYGWTTNSQSQRLRTFITKPKSATGKVPVIFFVGWLSCDSVEYPRGAGRDGFAALVISLIEESGFATVRMDKPGVGESQGDCAHADYDSELSGYRNAFDNLSQYAFLDLDRIFVVGLSNGGGVSPLVPRTHPVLAYVAAGSWGRTWYEHMLELERRRLTAAGDSPADVNRKVAAFTQFYDLYLIQKKTPGEIIAAHPEWKSIWYDEPGGQYGRPAAFYQQLQALNLGELWQNVTAPVLVIHGADDDIMSHADSVAIADTVNRAHPNHARFVEIPGMDHGFTVSRQFHQPLVPEILTFMRAQLR
jgi:pimeloyl-ACP methyl ester carboxylesterase